jgi:hypothetical protein
MLFIVEYHCRCPWQLVYMSIDDQVMITLTGIDLYSFHYLLNMFAPVDEQKHYGKRWIYY